MYHLKEVLFVFCISSSDSLVELVFPMSFVLTLIMQITARVQYARLYLPLRKRNSGPNLAYKLPGNVDYQQVKFFSASDMTEEYDLIKVLTVGPISPTVVSAY